ncbi:MAG: hypothetical protein KatS3mg129_0523 [Leptospiraceae bacterium]|nr:MAG: hypothetical protein KatS3mg129_0523 [Leptospiraceae bacterium]
MKCFKVKYLLLITGILFHYSLNAISVYKIPKKYIELLQEKEKQKIQTFLKIKSNENIKWYKLKIPENINKNCFYFSEIKQLFEVYEIDYNKDIIIQIDKIYQFGNLDYPEYKGNPFHIICTNKKVLYFRIYSFDKKRIGITGKILVGTKEDFYKYIIKKEFIDIILGIMYILTGLYAFLLFLFYHKYKLFLHFSLFLIFLGIASFTTNNIKYIYLENAIFWSWINISSLFLTSAYSLIFVSSFVINRFKKLIITFSMIQILIGLLLFIIAIKYSFLLYKILVISAYLAIINSLISILYILYNVFKKDKEAIIFLIGISILCFGAILDSIVIINVLEYNSLYFNISMFLFLLLLAGILLKEQRKNFKKLETIEIEFELAYNVHKKLIPKKAPIYRNLEIQFDYNPSYYLGGDFIHFIEINKNELGIFIGDISGHGISASLYSSTIYHLIRALHNYYTRPAKLLSNINKYLCDYSNADFITGIYLYIDLEKNVFYYASAGHTDLLYFYDKKILLLSQTGPALGVKKEANFNEYVYHLKNDSILLLYTDGFIEVFNKKNEMLNQFGLIQSIIKLNPYSYKNTSLNFFKELRKYLYSKGYKFYDDQAGIMIYFNNV